MYSHYLIPTQIVRFFCCLIYLLAALPVQSQSTDPAFKWGKTSDQERDMVVYDAHPDAAAVVLADYGRIMLNQNDVKYLASLERQCRIKIFNEKGFDQADIKISYYHHEKAENIINIRGQTINPDGSVTALNKKDIFIEKINDYWSSVKFALPNIQPGSIIEYSYRHTTDRINTLFEWSFQSNIPTISSELYIDLPGYMDYFILTQGESALHESKRWKGRSEQHGITAYTRNLLKMAVKDAPALQEEAYVSTIENFRTRVRFQLSGYYNARTGQREEVLGDWNKLHRLVLDKEGIGGALTTQRKAKNFLQQAAGYITSDMSETQKMNALYNFITKNIKWNGYQSTSISDSFDDILAAGETASGAVNICLLKLLREHGLDAHPILTSTRSNGELLPAYPIFDQFNHLMILCTADNNIHILDAIEECLPPGMCASRHLNKMGWLLLPDQHQWIEIGPRLSSDIFQMDVKIDEKGALRGEVKSRYTNYSAIPERQMYHQHGGIEETWRQKIGDRYPVYKINDAQVKDLEELNKPFSEQFKIEIEDFVEVNGTTKFVNPLLFTQFAQNPFKSENRYYPVEFAYPVGELVSVAINIPENWEVASLPEPVIATLDGKIDYSYKVELIGNTIRLLHKLDVKEIFYEADEYQFIRQIFDLVAQSARNQIIFKEK